MQLISLLADPNTSNPLPASSQVYQGPLSFVSPPAARTPSAFGPATVEASVVLASPAPASARSVIRSAQHELVPCTTRANELPADLTGSSPTRPTAQAVGAEAWEECDSFTLDSNDSRTSSVRLF